MLFLILSICGAIISVGYYETELAKETFYKKAPDMIAIFTGDSGRIPFGLIKALEYQTPQIFITGVYTSNSIKTLLLRQSKDLLRFINLNSGLIEIDYLARNTVENVLSTIHFLRKNNNYYRSVLIISSNYHILRIKLILSILKGSTDNFQFYFMGQEIDYWNWRNIKPLLKEVYKTLKTCGFLLLWESEFSITNIEKE
ncbi:MAG: hypothetical protein HQK53_04170 [Oligoflexia bacterium]|nr:hypothetical protein [Oligoflexia bacterium]